MSQVRRRNLRITFRNWNASLFGNKDYSELYMKIKNSTKQNSTEREVVRLGNLNYKVRRSVFGYFCLISDEVHILLSAKEIRKVGRN